MENETKELSTYLIKEHYTIAELFVDKVRGMLAAGSKEVDQYNINKAYGYVTESLKVKIGDSELSLQIYRKA